MATRQLERHFEQQWNNPVVPFNPYYDPNAKNRYQMVGESMTRDNYYATHTRAECKKEWGRRYDSLAAYDLIKDDPK